MPVCNEQHGLSACCLLILRRWTMNTASKLTLVMALLCAAPAALAQSAYTTGTIANSVAAGYPSPYRTGNSFYDHAPGLGARRHYSRARSTSARRHDRAVYNYVPSDPLDPSPNSAAATGGGSLGYNQMVLIH